MENERSLSSRLRVEALFLGWPCVHRRGHQRHFHVRRLTVVAVVTVFRIAFRLGNTTPQALNRRANARACTMMKIFIMFRLHISVRAVDLCGQE